MRLFLLILLVAGCPTGSSDDDDTADAACAAPQTWHIDYDGDGFGSEGFDRVECDAPTGYVADATDCDDTEPTAFPGGVEVCDGLDNDCEGTADVGAVDALTWWEDGDGDGFGGAVLSEDACDAPSGFVAGDDDCDDEDPEVHPDAVELCDGVDNDCDGVIDVDALDAPTWYGDADQDGFGDAAVPVQACDQPEGYVGNAGDCDDTATTSNPLAVDNCDAIDNDCDGMLDEDVKSGWVMVTVDTEAGWIYEIDLTTAAMTAIAPVEVGLYINSLDVWEGGQPVVHASQGLELRQIDICTGNTQPIGPTGVNDMGGIAFRTGYRLYGLDFVANQLVELDPYTGAGVPIGDIGFDVGPDGLAYDCTTDTLWGADANTGDIFTVDPATGVASGFVATGIPFQYVGLEYDHSDGSLWAATGTALYQIDPATGASTYIGPLDGVRINDLAFHPPCP